MEIVAISGENRFIVKLNNTYYLVTTRTKKIMKIEDPNDLYRQGYWKEFKGRLDDERRSIIRSLLNEV